MRPDAQCYLEQFCDTVTARAPATLPDAARTAMLTDLTRTGVEPFDFGAALRLSPRRTKAVMRELLQYHLLNIEAVRADDGRNELRLMPNQETARWYARVLRARRRALPGMTRLGRG